MHCEFVELHTAKADPIKVALELVGFQISTNMNGWDATNGAFGIRLVPATPMQKSPPLTIIVDTRTPASSFAEIEKKCGAICIDQQGEHDCEFILCSVSDSLQIRFLWTYNEDDKKELPALPKKIEWEESADLGIRSIIAYIPLAFRQSSRNRITRVAEDFAAENDSDRVKDEHAIRGIIYSTPAFDHHALTRSLKRFFTYEPWIDDTFIEAAAEQKGES